MAKEGEYPVASSASQDQINTIRRNTELASVGVPGLVRDTERSATFFFAFDGTGNNKDDADRPSTNVAALFDAAAAGFSETGRGKAEYFQGAGTQTDDLTSKFDGLLGTSVHATATRAYEKFAEWARKQYSADPLVEINLSGVSFSRGGASHTAFLNMVWQQGVLADDGTGKYLIPPETANLGANVFYDRVLQGVRNDSTELIPGAPLSKFRALEYTAEHEHRREFTGDPVGSRGGTDPRVLSLINPGDHSDNGGAHWKTAIGQETLLGAYNFLKESGVPLGPLVHREQYGSLPMVIHDSFKGFWGVEGGPHLASWVGDRISALYYKNHVLPGADPTIDPYYKALPTSLNSSVWQLDEQGNQLAVGIQAGRLADAIAPPLGLRLAAAKAITFALGQMDATVRAFVDADGNLGLADETGAVAWFNNKGDGGWRSGSNQREYANGELIKIINYRGLVDGLLTTETQTTDGRLLVETLDTRLLQADRLYTDATKQFVLRETFQLDGSCRAIDYTSDGAGGKVAVESQYLDGYESVVTQRTRTHYASDGSVDRVHTRFDGSGDFQVIDDTGQIVRDGFYIADSGRGKVGDMTRYLDIETFRRAADVPNAYAIYTVLPIKYWDEHIDAIGNARDNTLIGNRGDNLIAGLEGDDLLDGGAGNDLLEGGTGGDVYRFGVGSGRDRIREDDADADAVDIVQLGEGVNAEQLWFEQVGLDLQINLRGTDDSLTVERWFEDMRFRTEQIRTADGGILIDQQVSLLVEAMASFAPPPMATCMLPMPERGNFSPVLAASWG
ncbi:hypothetical protein VARIO8X_150008 [Burkholderiales bacterium 8X]|nr:hypothetical protein VARIO8X_150008 [Burkholderiales bacterium 8X]